MTDMKNENKKETALDQTFQEQLEKEIRKYGIPKGVYTLTFSQEVFMQKAKEISSFDSIEFFSWYDNKPVVAVVSCNDFNEFTKLVKVLENKDIVVLIPAPSFNCIIKEARKMQDFIFDKYEVVGHVRPKRILRVAYKINDFCNKILADELKKY